MLEKEVGNMKKLQVILLLAVMVSAVCIGCGREETIGNVSVNDTAQITERIEVQDSDGESQKQQETEETKEEADVEKSGQVALKEEMAAPIDVVTEDMTPVYGKDIKPGTYQVTVDSSSSMFQITSCQLIVVDDEMKAVMTMSGTGYGKLYMGTGEEAVNAKEEAFIAFQENENGEHTFTVPVQALDMGIKCAAFSVRKEKWYDRVLVFRADSLPQDAFAEGMITTTESLALTDGSYLVKVALEGGSGKTTVESPAKLKVEDGKSYAIITFSSPNYDYMIVDGEKYLPINTEGNSSFEIPVGGFDFKLAVSADTTAMSTPHEIEYTLYFDSKTIHETEE